MFLQHPGSALRIFSNRHLATAATIDVFGFNGYNDKADAFRHAYFQCINVISIADMWENPNRYNHGGLTLNETPNTADLTTAGTLVSEFATAHESEVPLTRILEKTMDLHNNGIGISYGLLYPEESFNSLKTIIYSAVINGELRYLNPLNTDGTIIIGQTQLIPTNQ